MTYRWDHPLLWSPFVMHNNFPNQTFPDVNSVSTSRETNMSFLLNPWEDSQRTRPRVRSMKERSPNYPTTSSLDPPISFPEPDFTPSISSLYISSKNLRHRHSAGDLRSQFQISVSHHEDYGEPSDQGNPKVRCYPSHAWPDRAPKYLSLGTKTEKSHLLQDQNLSGF